ncbi:FAD-binding domain-containing protein [Patellaria atrata CBS 101060]|uniref:FAD-binding domain-containing protein n=1 Tax=Patellaria atrata CBS 101060 TaxID=1346257 RepID=A0A9P4VVI1_9PEZI|nr:FAD-binding domain-containing protein [Patellaria atrata CBS 101060]
MIVSHRAILAVWGLFWVSVGHSAVLKPYNVTKDCYYLPQDQEWPSVSEWAQLNKSVDGRLIAGRPMAEVCRRSTFQSESCADLKKEWILANPHFQDPVSFYSPYWLNNTCSPFADADAPCDMGNLPSYAINVSSAADVAAGLRFARTKNIRLTIKNTGHDFNGRSSGQGALSLWMHNLNDISFFDYIGPTYLGRAVRMHSGVQAWDAYAAAGREGVRMVGGFCPTVGLVGGYVQGGGHGPLAPMYGMAADNTLEFEVVTADGRHLNVSATQHPDLFWALNGGGGGNYAVVLSQVTKVFPDGIVGGATLTFNKSDTPAEQEPFWDSVTAWQKHLLTLNSEPGFQAVYTVTNFSFQINFLTWPGKTKEQVNSSLAPFRAELDRRNINFTQVVSDDSGYHKHFARYTPGLPFGKYVVFMILGGRLIPRRTLENDAEGLTTAIRSITEDGRYTYNGISMNVSHARAGNEPGANAVLPAWRDAAISSNIVVEWHPEKGDTLDMLLATQKEMNDVMVPQLEMVSPNSGTYMNEGTFDLATWKDDYYGTNYDKLLEIKKKWDPDMIFYGKPNVGNEYWKRMADGRLCRA